MLKPDSLPVTCGKHDVEISARETLYRGFLSLDLYRFRHRLFNGQMSHEVRRVSFVRDRDAVSLHLSPDHKQHIQIWPIQMTVSTTMST
ncbi:ADP-ribose pyrophosphatase, partial [Escherichia coli]|nr:ADP-ribose pyrophosphatase [Escherichia coli]